MESDDDNNNNQTLLQMMITHWKKWLIIILTLTLVVLYLDQGNTGEQIMEGLIQVIKKILGYAA